MKKTGKTLLAFLTLALLSSWATLPPHRLWELFAMTSFEEKLNRSLGMYFYYPNFAAELRAKEGEIVELEGFHIPLELADSKTLILSKYPMAECFFCGGAGPESVAVVYLKSKPSKRIKLDQILKIKGRLKLNSTDVEEMTFILLDAELLN